MEEEPELDDYDQMLDYREPRDIASSELSGALSALHLLGDDPYLRMQTHNLAVVDHFIMRLEFELLQASIQEERLPPVNAMFLSAQSQMWIFAAYELLRTWRQRAKDVIKWHTNGGLHYKIEGLEREIGYVHVGRQTRATQLRRILEEPKLVEKIDEDLRTTYIPFTRIEFIRIALAKHEVRGNNKSIAYEPGYGRINQCCGSLEYELEKDGVILGNISRRDIADELRAISDRSSVPSEADLARFDASMSPPASSFEET
jgi:hypothetical protein